MPVTSPTASVPRHQQHFRRQWHRTVIPAVFAMAAFGLFAHRVPDSLWVAVPALCFSLLFCALLHGGLIISREGIAWYIFHPKWRYRVIPWRAVLDVRKTFFNLLHPILLTVQDDRYEPWVWGTPRQDRQRDVTIWIRNYAGGEAIWDVIQEFWRERNVAGVPMADAAT